MNSVLLSHRKIILFEGTAVFDELNSNQEGYHGAITNHHATVAGHCRVNKFANNVTDFISRAPVLDAQVLIQAVVFKQR